MEKGGLIEHHLTHLMPTFLRIIDTGLNKKHPVYGANLQSVHGLKHPKFHPGYFHL